MRIQDGDTIEEEADTGNQSGEHPSSPTTASPHRAVVMPVPPPPKLDSPSKISVVSHAPDMRPVVQHRSAETLDASPPPHNTLSPRKSGSGQRAGADSAKRNKNARQQAQDADSHNAVTEHDKGALSFGHLPPITGTHVKVSPKKDSMSKRSPSKTFDVDVPQFDVLTATTKSISHAQRVKRYLSS